MSNRKPENTKLKQARLDRAEAVSSVVRVDRSTFPKVSKTPEGYLRGEAISTRLGVFLYVNPDGSIRRELRHPDDVLKTDSLETLKMLPITVDHPDGAKYPSRLVSSDNVAELSVGMTGENYRVDGRHIITPLTITHPNGIEAVQNGAQELSLGYTVELVPEQGVYNGEEYTHRQTNITYNHLALVPQARAGNAARLNLDGAAVQSIDLPGELKMSKELVTVNLDGLNYDAAPEVAKALQAAQKRLDEAKEEKTDMEAKRADMQKKIDEYQAKIDEMTEEMKKMKESNSDSAISEAVSKRIALIEKASKVVTDSAELSGKNERQIMEVAIKTKHKDVALDGKSDDYVTARFDALIEALPDDAAARQVEKTTTKMDGETKKDARADAEDAVKNAWKKEAK